MASRQSLSHSVLRSGPALHALRRPQLLALCKRYGVKAKGTNVELVEKLLDWGRANVTEDGELAIPMEGVSKEWDLMELSETEEGGEEDVEEEASQQSRRRSPRKSPKKSPAKPAPRSPSAKATPPTPTVMSLADLKSLQRSSEAYVLQRISPMARSEANGGSTITLCTAPSPFRPQRPSMAQRNGGPLLLPDPDVSLSQPAAIFTSPIPGRRISNLPRSAALTSPAPDASTARFVFGSPEPEQRAVVEGLGGSMWQEPPTVAEAEEEASRVEDKEAADSHPEDTSAQAVDAVWAELNARTRGSVSSKASLLPDPFVVTASGDAAQSPSRFGKAHDKAFDQMDSIANHYAAKRKAPSEAVPALKSARSAASLADGAAPVGKRVKFSSPDKTPVEACDGARTASQRQLELARARRKAQGPSGSAPAAKSTPGRVANFGSRIIRSAVKSVRSLTGRNAAATAAGPRERSPAKQAPSLGFGAPAGTFGAGAEPVVRRTPSFKRNEEDATTQASSPKKKFDLAASLAQNPHFKPRPPTASGHARTISAPRALPGRRTPSGHSIMSPIQTQPKPAQGTHLSDSGSTARNFAHEAAAPTAGQRIVSSASTSKIPISAPHFRPGNRITSDQVLARRRAALAEASNGAAGARTWSSVAAPTAASLAKARARTPATPKKVGGKVMSSTSLGARGGKAAIKAATPGKRADSAPAWR